MKSRKNSKKGTPCKKSKRHGSTLKRKEKGKRAAESCIDGEENQNPRRGEEKTYFDSLLWPKTDAQNPRIRRERGRDERSRERKRRSGREEFSGQWSRIKIRRSMPTYTKALAICFIY